MIGQAAKHHAMFSRIRSTVALIEKSKKHTDHQKSKLLVDLTEELESHARRMPENRDGSLGLNDLIYPDLPNWPVTLQLAGFEHNMSYRDMKKVAGLSVSSRIDDKDEIKLKKWMENGQAAGQATNWIWRTSQAAQELTDWYPFFCTLTVDPKIVNPRELWKDTRAWQQWLRSIFQVVADEHGKSRCEQKNMSTREYVRYIATIEHGKSGVHDHVHAILWLKDIPSAWKQDPNKGLKPDRCIRRRCLPLETYWKYAAPEQRQCVYLRYQGDIWSRMNHVRPIVKTKKGNKKPLDLLPAAATGFYLGKYLAKEKKQWFHRMKATRGIGLESLKKKLSLLKIPILKQLTLRPADQNTSITALMTHSVPSGLLRSTARSAMYQKDYRSRKLQELMRPKPSVFKTMLTSVHNGAKPWLYNSGERYRWLTSVLPRETIAYCNQSYLHACRLLKFKPYQLTVVSGTGGNLA